MLPSFFTAMPYCSPVSNSRASFSRGLSETNCPDTVLSSIAASSSPSASAACRPAASSYAVTWVLSGAKSLR